MRRRSGAWEACDGNVIHSHGNDVSKRVNARGLKDTMLYPELFKAFEDVRWTFERDIPWNAFRPEQLGDERARSIKMNSIIEWEKRVVGMILKNLSLLFVQTFESVQQLNRFCKSLAAG